MNSNYEKIYDNLQYMRTIDDYASINSAALRFDEVSHRLVGTAIAERTSDSKSLLSSTRR